MVRHFLLSSLFAALSVHTALAAGPYGYVYPSGVMPAPNGYPTGYPRFRTVADGQDPLGSGVAETLPAPPANDLDLLEPLPAASGLASPPSPGVPGFPSQGGGALSAPPSYPPVYPSAPTLVPEQPYVPPSLAPAPAPMASVLSSPVPMDAGNYVSTPTSNHVDFGAMFHAAPAPCGGYSSACGAPCASDACGSGCGAFPGICTVNTYCQPRAPAVGCCDDGPLQGLGVATLESIYRTPDCFRSLWATYPQESAAHCDRRHAHLRGDCECLQGYGAAPCASGACGGGCGQGW